MSPIGFVKMKLFKNMFHLSSVPEVPGLVGKTSFRPCRVGPQRSNEVGSTDVPPFPPRVCLWQKCMLASIRLTLRNLSENEYIYIYTAAIKQIQDNARTAQRRWLIDIRLLGHQFFALLATARPLAWETLLELEYLSTCSVFGSSWIGGLHLFNKAFAALVIYILN